MMSSPENRPRGLPLPRLPRTGSAAVRPGYGCLVFGLVALASSLIGCGSWPVALDPYVGDGSGDRGVGAAVVVRSLTDCGAVYTEGGEGVEPETRESAGASCCSACVSLVNRASEDLEAAVTGRESYRVFVLGLGVLLFVAILTWVWWRWVLPRIHRSDWGLDWRFWLAEWVAPFLIAAALMVTAVLLEPLVIANRGAVVEASMILARIERAGHRETCRVAIRDQAERTGRSCSETLSAYRPFLFEVPEVEGVVAPTKARDALRKRANDAREVLREMPVTEANATSDAVVERDSQRIRQSMRLRIHPWLRLPWLMGSLAAVLGLVFAYILAYRGVRGALRIRETTQPANGKRGVGR